MSLGVIILAHEALDRVAQVARYWDRNGCPVVIHIDRRVARSGVSELHRALEGCGRVEVLHRRKCHWGGWSIVAATCDAAELLLARHPKVGTFS